MRSPRPNLRPGGCLALHRLDHLAVPRFGAGGLLAQVAVVRLQPVLAAVEEQHGVLRRDGALDRDPQGQDADLFGQVE